MKSEKDAAFYMMIFDPFVYPMVEPKALAAKAGEGPSV